MRIYLYSRLLIAILLTLGAFASTGFADIDTIWAGTNSGGDFTNGANGTGAADGSYAYAATNKSHTYSNFASAGGEKGVIDTVRLFTRVYTSASQSNDYATLTPSNTGVAKTITTAVWNSHVGSGSAGYEKFDITADKGSWLFTDFAAGTQVAVANVKNQGPDGGNFYYDAFAFEIVYSPNKPVLSIDTAYQSSTDGSGEATLQYDLTDVNSDPCKLTIEYSYDNATWFQAFVKSASTGSVDNTGVSTGTSTGQITSIATDVSNATFVWDTKNASNENGAFAGEDASAYLRATPNDGTFDGDLKTSSAFIVDDQIPVGYSCSYPFDSTDWPGPQPTLTCSIATDMSTISYFIDMDTINSAFTGGVYQSSGWQVSDYNWTVGPLTTGGWYHWRTKAKDKYGNEGAFAADTFVFQVSNFRPNVVIDSAKQTSTDGSGEVTIYFDVLDPQSDPCKLLFEYSLDNSSWSQVSISSSSTGSVDTTGVGAGTSTGQITGIPTHIYDQTCVWDSDNAGNEGGAFTGEDASVWVRALPNDGTYDGETIGSLDFPLDNQAPTGYGCSSPTDGASSVVLAPLLTSGAASDQSAVQYYFELAKDVAFSVSVQQSAWQSASTWTPPTPLNGNATYYWHVKARDAYGNEGAYAATFDFTTTDGWTYPSAGTIGPCVAPSLGDGVVYVGTGGTDDKLYCIATADGSLKWSTSIGGDALAVSSVYEPSASKYCVYVAISKNVYAYWDNGATVSSRWSRSYGNPARNPSEATPTPDRSNVYYAYNGAAYKVSNTDGTDATGWPTGGINASQPSSPVVKDAKVYFATTGGNVNKYLSDGTASGSVNVSGSSINTPLGEWFDALYVAPADNFIYRVDMSTMALIWTSPTLNATTGTGVFTLGDGYLYVGAGSTLKKVSDNIVTVPNDTSASVVWTYNAGGTISSTPIGNVDASQLYFGCDDNSAYGIDSAGTNISGYPKTDAANTLPNTPAVDLSTGIAVYTSTEGKVYGYAMQ